MKEIITVEIDRSKWRSGRYGNFQSGKGETLLKNPQGYMCCLGFVCEKYFPKLDVNLFSVPSSLNIDIPKLIDCWGKARIYKNSPLTLDLMRINDSEILSKKDREQALMERAAKDGLIFKFVGEYEKD